jgi:hypothetical protein
MNQQAVIIVFVVIIVVMVLVFALLAAGFIVLILFIGRNVGASRLKEMERYVADWAEEEGYELVELTDKGLKGNPFSERRPYRPGLVRGIQVKDRHGHVHRGWVFFPARLGPRGYSGFRLEGMEVEWEK